MSVFNFCFSVSKILGWFKNQRTAVGKLMKNGKSGQGAEVLSRRKKWQLSSFAFLRQHIVPPDLYTGYRRKCWVFFICVHVPYLPINMIHVLFFPCIFMNVCNVSDPWY